jgi:thymidylate synthase ThyX
MPIKTEIITDSISPSGVRLTTFILEYPRFIHSELMTHRVFSKNAASSRAIPFEKFVEQIKNNPAMPEFWGANQRGMQAHQELDNTNKTEDFYYEEYLGGGASEARTEKVTPMEKSKRLWLQARNKAIEQATLLNQLGLHKQIVNRILEPWFHIRVIFSGTDYENFLLCEHMKTPSPNSGFSQKEC